MNNHEPGQVNNKKQKSQTTIKLDSSVIKIFTSTISSVLENEITNFIQKNEKNKNDNINVRKLVNVQSWKLKYKDFKNGIVVLQSIVDRLEKELKRNKFAQPKRYLTASVGTLVKTTETTISNKVQAPQLFTLTDSEDEPIILTPESKIKPIQTRNENIIDLDNYTEPLKDNYKPGPKSKKKVSKPDLKSNDKVLPINTKASQKRELKLPSILTRKRKLESKSETKLVDKVPLNAKNNKIVQKQMRLNSVENSKVPEKNNHNDILKSSGFQYPPPYPSTPPPKNQPAWKKLPPITNMGIKTSENKVILTWNLNLNCQIAEIKMYELFVCKETNLPPDASMWKRKAIINAGILPMACEIEVFDFGCTYYFAMRAVDIHNRRAPFGVVKSVV